MENSCKSVNENSIDILYPPPRFRDGDDIDIDKIHDEVFHAFHDQFMKKGLPVKISDFRKFNRTFDYEALHEKWGGVNGSLNDIIMRMPKSVMDRDVTVQVVSLDSDRDCKLEQKDSEVCENDDINHPSFIQKSKKRSRNEDSLKDNTSKSNWTIQHIDKILSIGSGVSTDNSDLHSDMPLFLGQDNQMTTHMKFKDILIDNYEKPTGNSRSFACCIAQEPILSTDDDADEDSGNDDTSISSIICASDGAVTCSKSPSQDRAMPLNPLSDGIVCPSILLPFNDVIIHNINFWFSGHKKSASNWHHDGNGNILLILQGKKVIELCPPDAIQSAAIYSDHANHPAILRIQDSAMLSSDTLQRSLKRVQSSINNQRRLVDVSVGDSLYIPPGWWHRVVSYGPCLAVNIWFNSRRNSILSLATPHNMHMRAFQARELVRQYFTENYINAAANHIENLRRKFEGSRHPYIQSSINKVKAIIKTLPEAENANEVLTNIAKKLDELFTFVDIKSKRDRVIVLNILDECFSNIPRTSDQPDILKSIILKLDSSSCFVIAYTWNNQGKHNQRLKDDLIECSLKQFAESCGPFVNEAMAYLKRNEEEFKRYIGEKLIMQHLLMGNL